MGIHRVEITLSDEGWELLEAARGHEPRASFVKRALWLAVSTAPGRRALEKASGGVAASGVDSGSDPVAGSVPVRPASPRASLPSTMADAVALNPRDAALSRQAALNRAKESR